jgi:hypothetical protein
MTVEAARKFTALAQGTAVAHALRVWARRKLSAEKATLEQEYGSSYDKASYEL